MWNRDMLTWLWTILGNEFVRKSEYSITAAKSFYIFLILYPVDLYIDVQFLYERWLVFLVIVPFLDPLSETLWWSVWSKSREGTGSGYESLIDLSNQSSNQSIKQPTNRSINQSINKFNQSMCGLYSYTIGARYSPCFFMLQSSACSQNRILPLIKRSASRWLVSMAAACDE